MEEYDDIDLRLDGATGPQDVRRYVEQKLKRPHRYPEYDVTVWNFSTHYTDMAALEEVVPDLRRDLYCIPYQVTAVWAYIQRLLPRRLRMAEVLAYSTTENRYKAYPNLQRRASYDQDVEFRSEMAVWLNNNVEGP